MKLKQIKLPTIKQIPKIAGRIRLAEFFQAQEKEFAEFIKKVENGPVFKKLFYTSDKKTRAIRYRKFPRSDLSKNFYSLKEEIVTAPDGADVESLLADRKEVVDIIRSLGLDKFKEYFLYNYHNLSIREIADECGLGIEHVQKLNGLINDLSIYTEFFNPSKIGREFQIHYSKVASIERISEDFNIFYYSPVYARGRYQIDYEKIEELKKEGFFKEEELKGLKKLLRNLELINTRKTAIYQILKKIVEHQSSYLKTGDLLKLVPYTQKDLSMELDMDPSLVYRAISGRSIETPWGEEKPIKDLLPNEKKIRKILINEIIAGEGKSLSDEEIRRQLKEKYSIEISRRSVSITRLESKIPSSFKRKNR